MSRPDPAPTDPAVAETLRRSRDQFIALWGQMGANWGIPRTMAEVHALLYITGEPMNTDDVMAGLDISRGNASMTLRSLVDWGIIQRVHVRGDRKDYFQAEQDVWKLFRTILRERKKREIDPLVESLRECRQLTEAGSRAASRRRIDAAAAAVEAHNARIDRLLEFVTMIDALSQQMINPSGEGLELAAKLLERAS